MRPYSSYKDSGVEWIGKIPSDWSFLPLKYYFNYTKGSNGQKLTKTYVEDNKGEYPVYSGMTQNDGILGYVNEFEFDYPFPLIFTTTVGSKSMTVKLLSGKFSLSQNCLVMIKKKECLPPFVSYFLTYDFYYHKELLPTIFQPSLRMEDLDQYKIPIPSHLEQQQIVSFLDHSTQQIDDLIDKTEKKIELLKEKRTSLINHCVTKGLNPDVEMKDSGVEWIGEIPKGWDITKVKYLGTITSGDGLVNTELDENKEYPVYGGNGVMGYYDNFNRQRTILVIGRVGEKCGNIHLVNEKCWVTDNSLILSLHSNRHYDWVYYSLETRNLNTLRNQSSQPLITSTQLKNESIPFPSEQEQQQIVEYLDEHTQKIDSTIEKETQRIELLKEYRQSLISEVVTGKIDVREWKQ